MESKNLIRVGDRVRILVPYSGCGDREYKAGIVSEIVTDRIVSIAPLAVEMSCHGRVCRFYTYHTTHVDFAVREIRPRQRYSAARIFPWAVAPEVR